MTRLILLAFYFVLAATAPAAEPPTYAKDVQPILAGACFKCHGPDLKKGGLDLQTLDSASRKLESDHRAIAPGDVMQSELLRRVSLPASDEGHMPPKGQLTPDQQKTLKTWISNGAQYQGHWAFTAPKKAPLKKTLVKENEQWAKTPIDSFVLAGLEKAGLTPNTPAAKAILARRVSLDLTGLPPSAREVDDFVNNSSPGAYEQYVDRLLQSPHYGEHMARMWLDLARYADTNGYEKDDRRTIWPWRDWVINAFNTDMPYDRFTIEQLAGDLLPKATKDQKIATGFHRNTMTNTEGGVDDEEYRVAAVVDRVNTTMETWMGLSFGCAQCHTHKFDPFTQKEYYQVFAIFNGTTDGGRSTSPELALPTEAETKRKSEIDTAAETAKKTANAMAAVIGQVANRHRVLKTTKAQNEFRTLSTLVVEEALKRRETFVHVRGEFRNPGPKVMPGVPAKLPAAKSRHKLAPFDRLDFATWLVQPENPLVGRVMVNRIWARMFGKGIVETLEDFGVQGETPSHPELLDWLAVDFSEKGWSFKKLCKTIVMSATYQQASSTTAAKLEKDPYNRLLGRGPRFRLDAEAVRDNALTISGLINRKVGGPSVFPFQPDGVWMNPYSGDRWVESKQGDQYRRGLYTFWRRTAPYAMFQSFDAPSREVSCSRRPRTNTPLQALATLNDTAFVVCASALARNTLAEGGKTDADKVAFAFKACVSRAPTAQETKVLTEYLQAARKRYSADAIAAKALAGVGGTQPAQVTAAELAAWTLTANVLLNLDETVTKE